MALADPSTPAAPPSAQPSPGRVRRAPLTGEQERELAQRIETGKEAATALAEGPKPRGRQRTLLQTQVADGEAAKVELVTKNMPLAVRIAQSYRHSGLELADLIQEGSIGLLQAADSFDWRFGVPFSTWANRWIKRSIERNLMVYTSLVRMPVDALYERHRVLKARDEFTQTHQREPSGADLAAMVDISEDRVLALLAAPMERVPIETGPNTDTGNQPDRVFVDDTDAASVAVANVQVDRLKEAFGPFTEQEVQVLLLRTGAATGTACSIREAAERLGMAPRAVHVLEQSFVAKAKHPRFAMIPAGTRDPW